MGIFRAVWSTLLLIVIWAACMIGFARIIDSYTLADDINSDGIVVLTGGGGRVEHGLELLATHRGKALFISGVGKEVPMGDLIHKAPSVLREILSVASAGSITLGHEATNTIGNAQESIDWIKKRRYTSVMLVTADYHMPRALAEFKAGLPGDVKLIPAPVKTGNYAGLSWVSEPQSRNLILGEFHKLIAAKLRHWFIRITQAS
jgi:uncharacterized SAM-binding protein YcdF (DUF218 family)